MWSSQFIWPSNLPMFGLLSACPHSLLKKKKKKKKEKIYLFLIVCERECVHVCLCEVCACGAAV